MKTLPLLVAASVAAVSLLALAPTAEARQVCTFRDWDCPGFVCVWNRLEARWTCFGDYACPQSGCDPCRYNCAAATPTNLLS